jgi:hypothetical protein
MYISILRYNVDEVFFIAEETIYRMCSSPLVRSPLLKLKGGLIRGVSLLEGKNFVVLNYFKRGGLCTPLNKRQYPVEIYMYKNVHVYVM